MERLQPQVESQVKRVAWHEQGHAIVARAVGALVHKITVIPEGRSLGHCISSLSNFTGESALLRRMAICYGGKAAEELMGITDHSGCAADIATARRCAETISHCYHQGKISIDYYISEALSWARSEVRNRTYLDTEANRLCTARTLT